MRAGEEMRVTPVVDRGLDAISVLMNNHAQVLINNNAEVLITIMQRF